MAKHLKSGGIMTSKTYHKLDEDAGDPNCDPRLKGWKPVRSGIRAPDRAMVTITKIEERPPSSLFDRRDLLIVHHQIVNAEETTKVKRATFERMREPNLGSIATLQQYVRSYMRGTLEEISWPLTKSVRIALASKQAEAFARLSLYDKFNDLLNEWNPAELTGRRIQDRIPQCLQDVFELGMLAREIELQAAFEEDAARARRSAAGADTGGQASGVKRTNHAKAWKSKFAAWLQPHIDSEVTRCGGGISREEIAKFVDNNWKSGGFFGTYAKQATCPKPGSLMKILKELEKSGEIVRPSPPRGRKRST